MINTMQWSDGMYVVVAIVVVGTIIAMGLLNWFFDNLLD